MIVLERSESECRGLQAAFSDSHGTATSRRGWHSLPLSAAVYLIYSQLLSRVMDQLPLCIDSFCERISRVICCVRRDCSLRLDSSL